MDFLRDDVKKLYVKFLSTSVLSALVVSVYAFVDTIAIGQSEGPLGTAAMAVIAPLYGLFAFFSTLCGIGGAVQMSKAKGEGNENKGNKYFTSSLFLMGAITIVVWILLALFHKPVFKFFGTNSEIMSYVMAYAKWMLFFFPAFIFPPFIGAFIRNDGNPNLVMTAVTVGGCINIFGDWFFVFPLKMGIRGAAIATVLGVLAQTFIMCIHFFTKKSKLKIVRPSLSQSRDILLSIINIAKVGFGSGIVELGTVVIAILMNNQILKYGSTTELAIYGVILTIFQLFAAIFSGAGQAIQPLVSSNFGAGNHHRNRQFWNMAFVTVIFWGLIFTLLGELFPVAITKLFIDATPEVIQAAPGIFRLFFLLFIPAGISVLSIYYLQSIMCHKKAMVISLMRGIVVSGMLILILPLFLRLTGIWIALPTSELIVSVLCLFYIHKTMRK